MLTAARTTIASTLHGGVYPTHRQLETLRAARLPMLRAYDHGDRRTICAGMILARVRCDDFAGALELAEAIIAAGPDPRDLELPVETLLALESALAEAFLAESNSDGVERHADRMLALVSDTDDRRWRHRALGLAAMAAAIDGRFDRAEEHLTAMARLSEEQGWDPTSADFMGAVAELLIAFTRMDGPRAAALVPKLEALTVADPSARLLSQLAQAVDALLRDDLSVALAISGRIARGAAIIRSPGLIRHCALCLEAEILIARGEPLQALHTLSGAVTPGAHILCAEVIRASAYLQLGDYRGALIATTGCVKIRARHSHWSLPGVLVRRAIANLRLGHELAALNDAEDAMHLLRTADPTISFFLVPKQDLEALRDFVLTQHPELRERLDEIRARLDAVLESRAPEIVLPALSARERVIAQQLRSPLSYPEIADREHVALSTIKSQALSVFKKLGVNTRDEAVLRLERAGFYES